MTGSVDSPAEVWAWGLVSEVPGNGRKTGTLSEGDTPTLLSD